MSEKTKNSFVGYDYKEIVTTSEKASMYLDGYDNFGWETDGYIEQKKTGNQIRLKLKRDRKIMNKMELTRLQRNFDACMEDIEALEKSIRQFATMITLIIGIIGTVFITLSVFAVTHEPPIIWACVLFAIPGFIGWILPIVIYKSILRDRVKKVELLIEEKQDEIYELCEKGHKLLI